MGEDMGDTVDFFNQMLRGALQDEDDRAFLDKMTSVVDTFKTPGPSA
jgi:hypothetical protein